VTSSAIDRREFLQGLAAGGLLLVISATGCRISDDAHDEGPFEPAVYLRIGTDGEVTVIAHRSEFGQGIKTSLAMAVADELEADWARVHIEQAPGDKRYGSQDTDGSQSMRQFFLPMRRAGATGRAMLERAAARHWGVPASDVTARHHQVMHTPSGRLIEFAALVSTAKTLPVPAGDTLRLKQPSEFRYIGIGVPMVDLHDMTVGRAMYGIDQRVDGMRYAVVARPLVYGGTIASMNTAAAERVPGVERIIRLDHAALPSGMSPLGGVAVIATSTWAAIQGRNALQITWNDGEHARYDSRAYRDALQRTSRQPGRVVRRQGNAARGLVHAARRLVAEYYIPQLSHAPMEPPNSLAVVSNGRCEVWAPAQNPQAARVAIASALGLSVDAVRVNVTLIGGAFGRKSFHDFIVESALLSRAAGAPVKVIWTREDDLQHDFYHPPAFQHLEAGLDANGRVTAWLHRSTIPSLESLTTAHTRYLADWETEMGFIDLPYMLPNLQLEVGAAEAHTRLGWYRSVLNIPHAFAISSFIDEIAHATRKDPKALIEELLGPDRVVDMRRAGLPTLFPDFGSFNDFPIDTGRFRRVLNLVAQESGWGRPLPAGQGQGIAAVRASSGYLTSVVQVNVQPDGTIMIPRVDIGIDAGFIVHPDRVRAQMEGGTIMGLGNALGGEITFAHGRAEQSNFNSYKVLRLHEAPREIHVHLIPSDGKPSGVGEPAVAPTAPALCNAIFAATGRRIRTLPIGQQLHDLQTDVRPARPD
jgi:isoquinoline 1-oxidoreductase subunit beta